LRLLFCISTLLTFCVAVKSQINLVPNPGFEEYFTCPGHLSQFNGVVKYWVTPTTGTPNYYHACASQPEVGMPFNYFGYKQAMQGSAYTGIMTSSAFREYITVELKSPLLAGKNYRLGFYTSVILRADCKSKGLDILLSALPPYTDQPGANVIASPTLSVPIDYTDESWVLSQVCFQANGDERFLTIGDMKYPRAQHNCQDGAISYYFIDMVSLEEIIPYPRQEINVSSCNLNFPLTLDGAIMAGANSSLDNINWQWEDSIFTRLRTIHSSGNYRLKVQYPHCIQSDYIIRVSDLDCRASLFIPNIFTPDGDGLNDLFEIHSRGIWLERMTIYNRTGQPVFSTTDPEFKWDGSSGDNQWPAGVYVYLIRYKNILSNITTQKSGSLTLVR